MSQAVGIDVSARRGIDLALLDDGRVAALAHLSDVRATVDWLVEHVPGVPIGIDAPQKVCPLQLGDAATRATVLPPPPAGRYARYRICDYQLARRGIGLYLLPHAGEPVPDWMSVGFALFASLRAHGWQAPLDPRDYTATLLEVYPYAAFVTLLGAIPPRKSTPAGSAARLALLAAAGIRDVPETASHDGLDAIAAALTVARFAAALGCALGNVQEGLMVLPVPEATLLERYRKG